MILGSDGEKMSKSRGNVVNPDDIVGEFGGDALRMYEMFMGPLEAVKPWQTAQVRCAALRVDSSVCCLRPPPASSSCSECAHRCMLLVAFWQLLRMHACFNFFHFQWNSGRRGGALPRQALPARLRPRAC